MEPWVKRRKNLRFYETLLAQLWLEEKYNYKSYLQMTSENIEEVFQLIKDDATKTNPKMRGPIPRRLQLAATISFLSTGKSNKSYVYECYFFYSAINSSTFTSFRAFVFSIFSSLMISLVFFTSHKNFL